MDMTAIASLTSAISAAREIAQGAIGVRDAVLINEATGRLVQKLLDAQNALLEHNAALLQLQNEHFKVHEELRELREAASERGRYTLFELVPGKFAYRVNIAPEQSGSSEPGSAEPLHYVCQGCFDQGRKAVLRISEYVAFCPLCKDNIRLRERPAQATPQVVSAWSKRDW
jgi:hypothetical protein